MANKTVKKISGDELVDEIRSSLSDCAFLKERIR